MLRGLVGALVCSLVVLFTSACCAETLIDSDPIVRPTRPKNFASPDDLRVYLDQLGQYYAVVGRPRFGKRGRVSRLMARREEFPVYIIPQRQRSDISDVFEIFKDHHLQSE